MHHIRLILLSALCILTSAKLAMRITNSLGNGKNAKFYYCSHFKKPSTDHRPVSIKFENIRNPKSEFTVKATSTRLPRRLTSTLRLCWRLKLSKTLDLPKGSYRVVYLNANDKAIDLNTDSKSIINIGNESESSAAYESINLGAENDKLKHAPKETKFRSLSAAMPKNLPRHDEFIKAIEQSESFKIVDTVYTSLKDVDETEKGGISVTTFAKGPNGIDVVIKGARLEDPQRMIHYVDERETLFKLGRLLQYDDANLFLVSPRILGPSLKAKIKTAHVSEYQKLLDGCLIAILELNKLGIAQDDFQHPGNFIIDQDGKCHAIDFGNVRPLEKDTDQRTEFMNAFNSWWDYSKPRPYYAVNKHIIYPTATLETKSDLLLHSMTGYYTTETEHRIEAVLSVVNDLRHESIIFFEFKDGKSRFEGLSAFENMHHISEATGKLIDRDNVRLILTLPVNGEPLSTVTDEQKAKAIWKQTIKRYHDAQILVGHISSDNIIVDAQGIGHLKDTTYTLALKKPYIRLENERVQEKLDLEMEFLKHLQQNCPLTVTETSKPICRYRPVAVGKLLIAKSGTIETAIEAASKKPNQ